MNLFLAEHWYSRYQFITQCSPGHPFMRKLKNGEVKFTDPKKLIEFLKDSVEASFMWSDSDDLAILADMQKLKLKIITTKGHDDKNPTVNWIYPDTELGKFAELKDVKLNDMILLHEDDNHFNLIVNNRSDLAVMGSLSYRFNVGPMMETCEDGLNDVETKTTTDNIEKETTKSMEDNDDKKKEKKEEERLKDLVEVRKELKQCKLSKNIIEAEYYKCEKELKVKTEEVEKLKLELKDLKEIKELEKELKDKEDESNHVTKDDSMDVDEPVEEVSNPVKN